MTYSSIVGLIRWHWGAICAAAIMTILVSSPLITFPFFAGDSYRGINIFHFGSDEHIYLTRAKEVLEGHGTGQPILNAYKDTQDPTFSYIERVVLSPFTLTGLSSKVDVVTIYNIYDFLGIFGLVLMLYALLYAWSRDKWLSVAGAMFVIGGYSIVFNKALFYNDFNVYLRSNFPYMASLPFFLMCFLLYRACERSSWRYAIAASIPLSLLFYDYFYGWTFALTFLGGLFLSLLLTKEYRLIKYVVITGGIALLVAIPVLFQYVTYLRSDLGKQLSYFLLSATGHVPVMSFVGIAAMALLIVYWYLLREDRNIPFIMAAIIAGWVALNEQVITGRYIQYGHYYWYFIVPLSILLGVYLMGMLLPQAWRRYFSVLLVFVVLLNTTVGQYRSFFVTVDEKLRDQDYAPFLSRLQELPPGAVLTPVQENWYPMLVTIYTDKDLFYGESAATYNLSVDYMKDVLLLHLFLNKDARTDPIGFLSRDLDSKRSDEYTIMYEDFEGYYSGKDYYTYHRMLLQGTSSIAYAREPLFAELRKRYAELFGAPGSAREFLLQKGVRYILWDKRITPEWDVAPLKLNVLKEENDIALYSL